MNERFSGHAIYGSVGDRLQVPDHKRYRFREAVYGVFAEAQFPERIIETVPDIWRKNNLIDEKTQEEVQGALFSRLQNAQSFFYAGDPSRLPALFTQYPGLISRRDELLRVAIASDALLESEKLLSGQSDTPRLEGEIPLEAVEYALDKGRAISPFVRLNDTAHYYADSEYSLRTGQIVAELMAYGRRGLTGPASVTFLEGTWDGCYFTEERGIVVGVGSEQDGSINQAIAHGLITLGHEYSHHENHVGKYPGRLPGIIDEFEAIAREGSSLEAILSLLRYIFVKDVARKELGKEMGRVLSDSREDLTHMVRLVLSNASPEIRLHLNHNIGVSEEVNGGHPFFQPA